jgi:hypothetical protein
MFKQGNSFEDEIFRSMENTLVKNQTEQNTHGLSRVAKAVDFLNDAAAIFERAGMTQEAEMITGILAGLAKDLNNG